MISPPLSLIAEITHRCPLHCVYCSNPLALEPRSHELSTEDWTRVFAEAGKLGVLHLHLTGGEPLARPDLTQLVAAARDSGLYANLITSGMGLEAKRLEQMVAAGLDHIQLSFQDCDTASADRIAGARAHSRKIEIARMIRHQPVAFTINLVVHRENLDHLPEMIEFIEGLGPDRIEVAHVQYYGWALRNRDALLPSAQQVMESQKVLLAAQERLRGRIHVEFVAPDYFARFPKACMGGWGKNTMLIDPAGRALPCHSAGILPGMVFDNVREHSLPWIWEQSEAFNKFRGEDWMEEPCSSCPRREKDFGGCRCQAFLLTGDAAATDPVCSLSPDRHRVDAALVEAEKFSAPGLVPLEAISREQQEETPELAYRLNPAA